MDEWLERCRARGGTLALLALAGLLGAWGWQGRPLHQPAGILAPEEPVQTEPESPLPWTFRGHRITPLAHFELRARVLSVERYRFDRAADLSPLDVALGWGPMSDSKVLEALRIRQQDRWYFWSTGALPLPADEISSHSANMHLIPADAGLAKRLLAVRTGQILELRGQLISAEGQDGWRWVSSRSRSDTGDGSCEVIWVESARVTDR